MNYFARNNNNGESSSSSSSRVSDYTVTGCGNSHFDRFIHGKETWALIRRAYNKAIRDFERPFNYEGMQVGFEVRPDKKGLKRSIHVTESVKKGSQLWEPYNYHSFRTEHEYIRFLKELEPHGRYLQCDVIGMTHTDESSSFVELTLDEGSFIQHGHTAEEINLDMYCVATKDIAAGEKLMMNTTEYVGADSIDWFNEIKSSAWKRTGLGGPKKNYEPVSLLSEQSSSFGGKQILIAPAILFCLFYVSKQFRGQQQQTKKSTQKAD